MDGFTVVQGEGSGLMYLGFRLCLGVDRVLTQTYIGYSTLSESLMTTKYTYDVFQGRDTYFNTG